MSGHGTLHVLYLFISYSERGSSVQDKVLNHIRYLNRTANTRCEGAFFYKGVSTISPLNEFVNLVPTVPSGWKYFPRIGDRRLLDRAIVSYLTKMDERFDLFYFRYPLATRGLLRIAKKFRGKLIFEHQAKEVPELVSLVRNERVRLKLGYLLYLAEHGAWKILNEWYFGSRVLAHTRRGIAVTREVAGYECRRSKGYACKVVGNGLDVNKFAPRPSAPFNGRELNIFILVGANTSSPTHGVDRLIESVKKNDSQFRIRLSIFSKSPYPSGEGENYRIVNEGYVSGDELTRKLSDMHFAIGGLASYRKRVFYGSALKVREYFARGFPVIMASIDEDIEQDPEARRYRIYVPNDRSLIDFKALSKDIAAILSVPDRGEIIGGIARRIFAYENKMSQLSELLKQYQSPHD